MLGKKIKEIRKIYEINQSQLAEKIGVSRAAVALWETDRCDPDITNIKIICKTFDVTSDYLLGIKENGKNN